MIMVGRVGNIETDLGIGAHCPLQSMARAPYNGVIGDVSLGGRYRSIGCAKRVAPIVDTPTPYE